VDSFLWRHWLWPEIEVLWFNTFLNRSAEWGVSPFHWYFSSALPRALLGAFILIPLGLLRRLPPLSVLASSPLRALQFDPSVMVVVSEDVSPRFLCYFPPNVCMSVKLLPVLVFVFLYSLLPHKELRFIFSALPVFNGVAAIAALKLYRIRSKNVLLVPFLVLLICSSFACSLGFLYVSSHNYPGGHALLQLHSMFSGSCSSRPLVHIDNLAAITGVSHFGEYNNCFRCSSLDLSASL